MYKNTGFHNAENYTVVQHYLRIYPYVFAKAIHIWQNSSKYDFVYYSAFFSHTVFPVITQPPVDVNANLSEEVNFTCIAIAKPRATIYWVKNMKTVIGNRLGRMVSNSVMGNCTITDPPSRCVSSSTLQILNTRAADSGEYTCVAANEVGNDTVTAQLIIDGM